MSTTVKSLTYRGDVKAAIGVGGFLVFVTVHPEGQPTGVFRVDLDKMSMAVDALPAGGTALVTDGDTLWVGGSDNRVYQGPARGGALKPLSGELKAEPVALALLAQDRLAVLGGKQVFVLSRKDGKVLQTLDLGERGSGLASDPTGQWLVAGTSKGHVTVFDGEGKPEFAVSESAKIHEGAVTALLFEPEELRFLSAGADGKLFSTHARGKLEPEDRGKGSNHEEPIVALLWAPGERFFTGSKDKSVKAWPRGGAKPVTQKDGIITVTTLALLQLYKKPHLAVGCDDNSFRVFPLDEAGKFEDMSHRVNDAYAWVRYEFTLEEPRRREAAIRALAEFKDTQSIDLLSEQIGKDGDHTLRKLACELLGASDHARAPKLLEQWLRHSDEAVRVAAFHGLRRHLGQEDLRPLDWALNVNKADVGRLAVQALEALAGRDDQAMARLTATLNHPTPEVRQAALASLEHIHPADSPEANLIALGSQHADLRRLTLVRLYQRQLLSPARVQSAVRWRTEDGDAEVRRTAFLLLIHTRPKLVPALRSRDAELHRQLYDLETFSKDTEQKKDEEVPPPPKPGKLDLTNSDHEPLLQATASRALDTCLRGARGLAVLGDARAFGLLLQLSRESDAQARTEVCRALAALDDPRSLKRLRSLLYDDVPAVRDAAFTALVQIHETDPLLGAEAGLNASYEDVRRRGLQGLISFVRQKPPQKANEPAWQLLVRALNDSFPGVRSEAFKAVLNLQIAGGGVNTLRFALQSIHADMRQEVLTELMAQQNEPWAWNLLLEFYNDPDPTLRGEAFEFAAKKSKTLEPFETGLRSEFADVRKKSVEALIKKHTPEAQALLVKSLSDADRDVRQRALESLVGEDARGPLTQALYSPHADVRVRAATALAAHGDAAALAPLLALATAAEPQEKERRPEWETLVTAALGGLAQLGDSAALAHVVPLLGSTYDSIRRNAADALTWVAVPHHVETLRQALQHADARVKYRAALGLAYAGDPVVAGLLFSNEAGQVLTPGEQLVGAFLLGPAGEEQLVVMLDHNDEKVRHRALLLLMMLELKANQGTPTRCLACLSSKMPRVRLTAARGLESFSNPAAFAAFVAQLFNDRGDEQAWKVPAETVDAVAELVVHGSPQTRARTAQLLALLGEKEQAPWNQAWAIHEKRVEREIAKLRDQAKERKPVKSQYTPEQLQQLAFGAYVGLVREQGGQGTASPPVIRVRQTALNRVFALAQADKDYAAAAKPVFIQALGDPNQPVRLQAFDHLLAMGMDTAELGGEALEAGHVDLGVRGLQLLSGRASAAEGQKVLEQAMLTRTDELAIEAAKLLTPQRGLVPVAGTALAGLYEPLRDRAVEWLSQEYDRDPAAKKHLRQALESRYQKVRESAAFDLARKKDPAAFDALVKVLATQDQNKQRRVIEALIKFGDPRTPDAFLDRLEEDASGTACTDELLDGVAGFRSPDTVERLMTALENDAHRDKAFEALITVSGYDQSIDDPEEEELDQRWQQRQHPRRDDVLARLLEVAFTVGEKGMMQRLIPSARWARGKDVDAVLGQIALQPDDELRQAALEAVGFRLRKRGGPAEPLLKTLQHKDPLTQLLAARGLARAGRGEGINVLLAAVDFMTDFHQRELAVHALGELGDLRALDALLKMANEAGHPMQATSVEALGHMSKSDKAEDIFRLLERYSKDPSGLSHSAIKGLRWLNTRPAWELIRMRAADPTCAGRTTAVEVLGYNDDKATRDLILRLLANLDYWGLSDTALTSARRLFGTDSLEPDYAWLQCRFCQADDGSEESSVAKVCQKGEAKRIFDILSRCQPAVQDLLATTLINRSPPLAEAKAALGNDDERTVQVAARILGRGGEQAAKFGADVQTALKKWRGKWEERRQKMARANQTDERLTTRTTPCLQSLVWAAGRLGGAGESLRAVALERADDRYYRPVRLEAVSALASGPISGEVLSVLETVALDNDPEIRAVAADAVGRHDPKRAAKLAEPLLSDRVSFGRLTSHKGVDVDSVLRTAVEKVHYQGVALQPLVMRGDVEGLVAVARNAKLPEPTRLGAIEGLALMAQEKAEAKLVEVGRNETDEDLRKAAWRGLRRSKRARQRTAQAKT